MKIKQVTTIKCIGVLLLIIGSISCGNKPSESSRENGDLTGTIVETDSVGELSPEQLFQIEKDKLMDDGWENLSIPNGQLPSCYNFTPQFGSIDNYLEVKVGSNTDVVIKIMTMESDSCIRYVYINSSSTYQVKNIPEGKYYLKIAYGKDWYSKVEHDQCIGKFIRNPLYEKGEDIMDFNLQYTKDGYNIPSYKLELDVIHSDIANQFNAHNISEDEFNK